LQIPVGMLLNGFDVFILVLVRMTGLFVTAPIFGRRNVPVYLKIGFSFFLAVILVNTLTVPKPEYFNNIYDFAFLVLKEFLVGITIGYVSFLVFSSIYLAGQLIDMQTGFSMVSVLDPMSNIQVPVTSNFYFIISMLIFLSINGHHLLIQALFSSYKMIPLGNASFNQNLMNDIIRVFGDIFIIGFKISAPIIAAILITDVALGVISRTMPQLNVFVVGMPLKIILGVLIIYFSIPVFTEVVSWMTGRMNTEVFKFMSDMSR
jgi:flagellar biosynthesis protein FliR